MPVILDDSPHQFEPLMPAEAAQHELLDRASDLIRTALPLSSTPVPRALRQLLRGMNSYYTNRIEGQHTRPVEIEQALRRDFSCHAGLAARQRLALAHMAAEEAVEARYAHPEDAKHLYSADAVADLHRELFSHLPAQDLQTEQGEPIMPGAWRQREVSR